jgi:hypothetical protein
VKILGTLAAISFVALIASKLAQHFFPKIVPFKDNGEQHITSPLDRLVFAFELYAVLDPGNQELDKVDPLVQQGGDE